MSVIDQLRDLQVFYVNIGGGEPTSRSDFYDLVDHAVDSGVGVKFSTNVSTINAARAEQPAGADYVDIQISLDAATPLPNDPIRGEGSYDLPRRAVDHMAAAAFGPFTIRLVLTRHHLRELQPFRSEASPEGE